jgi:hypothetical protein
VEKASAKKVHGIRIKQDLFYAGRLLVSADFCTEVAQNAVGATTGADLFAAQRCTVQLLWGY